MKETFGSEVLIEEKCPLLDLLNDPFLPLEDLHKHTLHLRHVRASSSASSSSSSSSSFLLHSIVQIESPSFERAREGNRVFSDPRKRLLLN